MGIRKSQMVGILLGLFIICGVGLLVFTDLGAIAGRMAAGGKMLAAGTEAPDFQLYTAIGRVMKLSQLRGKPVVLGFGTSYCEGCPEAANLLQNLNDNFPQLDVVWVSVQEDPNAAGLFADDLGLTYQIALDVRGEAAAAYEVDNVYAMPALYFLDQNGVIKGAIVEAVDERQVFRLLESIGVRP